ncbi:MAG: hypothetical protein PVJ47_03160 [Thiohalocapsa sp.]
MVVLDAVSVGLAALSGKPCTANVTDLLLGVGEYLEHGTARESDRLLRRLLRPDPAMAWVGFLAQTVRYVLLRIFGGWVSMSGTADLCWASVGRGVFSASLILARQ